jgi:hypothetical protein
MWVGSLFILENIDYQNYNFCGLAQFIEHNIILFCDFLEAKLLVKYKLSCTNSLPQNVIQRAV